MERYSFLRCISMDQICSLNPMNGNTIQQHGNFNKTLNKKHDTIKKVFTGWAPTLLVLLRHLQTKIQQIVTNMNKNKQLVLVQKTAEMGQTTATN